jgi:acetyl esterase
MDAPRTPLQIPADDATRLSSGKPGLADDATQLAVDDLLIPGHTRSIPIRLTRRPGLAGLPVVLYFHGGGFVSGSLDDADIPARYIALHTPALVISVGYSLAPAQPFPAAPEDAYAAATWALTQSIAFGADARRLAVAGDDAGGNLSTCVSIIARDRQAVAITAQAMLGPMLDPSMTRVGDAAQLKSDITVQGCADCYRQYLPKTPQRMHPYAAPLESVRLAGLPPAFIATAEHDVLHVEAEKYAAVLIAAGVRTQVARFPGVRHAELRSHPAVLAELTEFLGRHLNARAPRAS